LDGTTARGRERREKEKAKVTARKTEVDTDDRMKRKDVQEKEV
jgi:hypothetical protein